MKKPSDPPVGFALATTAILCWVCVVVASGLGWNPAGVPWEFETTAQLGDSFGVISSAMAGIAAYFAYVTFKSQQSEAATLKRRSAEPSYLNLLERRFDMLSLVAIRSHRSSASGYETYDARGQDALEIIVYHLRLRFQRAQTIHDQISAYEKEVEGKARSITSYYRFVFHIIEFAQSQFSEIAPSSQMVRSDPAYVYVKLLRAQLSDEDMIVMGLNALYGGGYPKLKLFIERYALLNNMREDDIEEFGFDKYFEPSAFGIV